MLVPWNNFKTTATVVKSEWDRLVKGYKVTFEFDTQKGVTPRVLTTGEESTLSLFDNSQERPFEFKVGDEVRYKGDSAGAKYTVIAHKYPYIEGSDECYVRASGSVILVAHFSRNLERVVQPAHKTGERVFVVYDDNGSVPAKVVSSKWDGNKYLYTVNLDSRPNDNLDSSRASCRPSWNFRANNFDYEVGERVLSDGAQFEVVARMYPSQGRYFVKLAGTNNSPGVRTASQIQRLAQPKYKSGDAVLYPYGSDKTPSKVVSCNWDKNEKKYSYMVSIDYLVKLGLASIYGIFEDKLAPQETGAPTTGPIAGEEMKYMGGKVTVVGYLYPRSSDNGRNKYLVSKNGAFVSVLGCDLSKEPTVVQGKYKVGDWVSFPISGQCAVGEVMEVNWKTEADKKFVDSYKVRPNFHKLVTWDVTGVYRESDLEPAVGDERPTKVIFGKPCKIGDQRVIPLAFAWMRNVDSTSKKSFVGVVDGMFSVGLYAEADIEEVVEERKTKFVVGDKMQVVPMTSGIAFMKDWTPEERFGTVILVSEKTPTVTDQHYRVEMVNGNKFYINEADLKLAEQPKA